VPKGKNGGNWRQKRGDDFGKKKEKGEVWDKKPGKKNFPAPP